MKVFLGTEEMWWDVGVLAGYRGALERSAFFSSFLVYVSRSLFW
jgi:hypothetical protein